MKLGKLSLLLVALCCSISLSAEQPQSKTDSSVEFRPHWDLQLQGGAAYTLGETKSFGKLLSPAVYLSTNYRFHHAMGIRIGVGGWQGKGVMVLSDSYYSYNFLQLNADYKLDLSSLIGGYNHKRVASVYVLAGGAFNYGFNNKEANALAANPELSDSNLEYLWNQKFFLLGRFGLGVDFRVSERINLNLEGNANVLCDHFNSKRADNADWHFNLLAGISYSFGKKHATSKVWLAEKAAAEEAARIAAERAEAERIARERAEAERREAERIAAEKAAAEAAAAEEAARVAAERKANIEAHSQNIFFTINSSYIRKTEVAKIEALAEWLKANADYKVAIVGFADKETGTSSGNMKLSERRVVAVKKALVTAGVEETRIITDHKGDTVQPFEKPAENRVVICTLE